MQMENKTDLYRLGLDKIKKEVNLSFSLLCVFHLLGPVSFKSVHCAYPCEYICESVYESANRFSPRFAKMTIIQLLPSEYHSLSILTYVWAV